MQGFRGVYLGVEHLIGLSDLGEDHRSGWRD